MNEVDYTNKLFASVLNGFGKYLEDAGKSSDLFVEGADLMAETCRELNKECEQLETKIRKSENDN